MSEADKQLKNCKECQTRIHRKAKICPQCRSPLSFFSSVKGFFQTGAWIIAAIVSLGFAAWEKAEKFGYSEQLSAAVKELDLANLTASVLQMEMRNPSAPPPAFLESGGFADSPQPMKSGMMAGAPGSDVGVDEKELIRIEERIQQELANQPRNDELLRQLVRRQQFLKTAPR